MELFLDGNFKTVECVTLKHTQFNKRIIHNGLEEVSSNFTYLLSQAMDEHNATLANIAVSNSEDLKALLPTDLLLAFTFDEDASGWKDILRSVLEQRSVTGLIMITAHQAPMEDGTMMIASEYLSSLPKDFFIQTYKVKDIVPPNDVPTVQSIARKILAAKGYDNAA